MSKRKDAQTCRDPVEGRFIAPLRTLEQSGRTVAHVTSPGKKDCSFPIKREVTGGARENRVVLRPSRGPEGA